MRHSLTRRTAPLLASCCAAALSVACSDPPATQVDTGGSGTQGSSGSGGKSAGSGGAPSTTGGSAGSAVAGTGSSAGGSGGSAGTGAPESGGTNATAGSSTSGGSAPVAGAGGTGSPVGGTSGAAGGTSGTGNTGPVSCAGIVDAGFELCSSGDDFCAAVFSDGEGCAAVCAAAGLDCAEVWENDEDACAADQEREQLSCDPASGHESDYCVCRGGNGQPGAGGSNGAGGSAGAGGSGTSGAAGSGGSTSSGGAGGTGGKSGGAGGTGGSSSGGTGNVPAVGPGPCGCETPAGEFGTVNATIIVRAGEVYDGQCKIYRANPDTLGAGDQEEGQQPIFRVEDGGELRNVVIGASGADGIHLYGDVMLENIHWLDIGEDAMTVKESGTVHLNCGSSAHGSDKTFQVNAAADIFITNFTATDAGKFMRQNGGTDFKVNVTIDHCDISSMKEVIFRTDSSTSHVTLTNTRYSKLGKGLFMFDDTVVNGNSAQSTVSNNQQY